MIQAALLLAVMSNLTQYFGRTPRIVPGKIASGATLGATRATLLMLCATVLVNVAPFRNLCFSVCMAAYERHGMDGVIESVLGASFGPLLNTGFCQVYTFVGYLFMGGAVALRMRPDEEPEEEKASLIPSRTTSAETAACGT